MQVNLESLNLDLDSKLTISRLLAEPQGSRTDLEQIWFLMDKVWDEYGCDNRNPDWGKINSFYSHPVWILNGLFIEQHDLSLQHREAISDWIAKNDFESVLDFGGGFGTLARMIARKARKCSVDIYEPHPSRVAIQLSVGLSNLNFVSTLKKYDCLVSTDVLEHVQDPLATLFQMSCSVKTGGCLIIANNFYPVVKCHLPQTFHLKYTFKFFAKKFGLRNYGSLHGSHAKIFKKEKEGIKNLSRIRTFENISQKFFPLLEAIHPYIGRIRRVFQ